LRTTLGEKQAIMRPIHLLLFSLILALIVRRSVQDGMFMDGVMYAALANNLANGIGSFWAPSFSAYMFPEFYEHPPLQFGLQALLFKAFGDHFAVERVYGLGIVLLTALLMIFIWRKTFQHNRNFQNCWPLPICVWLLNEDMILSYTGNMLECTMSLFCLGAIVMIWKAFQSPKNNAVWFFLATISTLCALLVKGIPGLYIWSFPLLYAYFFSEISIKKAAFYTFLWVTASVLLLVLLLQYPPAAQNLSQYFEQQIWAALSGNRPENKAAHRLYMLQRMLETHSHWIILTALLGYFGYFRRHKNWELGWKTPTAFFVCLGLAALIPICISPKQAPHYIVPALPWLALAIAAPLAVWFYPICLSNHRNAWGLSTLTLLGGLYWVGMSWGKTLRRDQALLSDIQSLSSVVPARSTISFRGEYDMSQHSFLMRYPGISLDCNSKETAHPFLLTDKSWQLPDSVQVNLEKVPIRLIKYDLYRTRAE
jgi:hypothetical protein